MTAHEHTHKFRARLGDSRKGKVKLCIKVLRSVVRSQLSDGV